MSSSSAHTLHFNYSSSNALKEQKKSRLIAGLLLTTVIALHLTFALFLLSAPKTEDKKPPVVMEVVMLSKSKPAAQEPPPAPPAVKEPIKPKPVVKPPEPIKKPAVVKKQEPKPELTELKDPIPVPKFEPAPSVAAPAPSIAPSQSSNSQATTKPIESRDDSKTVVSGVVELVCMPPRYPARAANRNIEGWVKLEFTIKTDGSVDDVVVVGAEPEGIFDDAAITAISKCTFKEKTVNGVAVPQRGKKTLQFKLEH